MRNLQVNGIPVPPEEQQAVQSISDAPERYTPPTQEVLQQYEINIQFLSRGCVIRVGCKSIPFDSIENAMNELNDYIATPDAAQQKWRKLLG